MTHIYGTRDSARHYFDSASKIARNGLRYARSRAPGYFCIDPITRTTADPAGDGAREPDLAMSGGAAFSKHLGLERLFRDARAGWVMAPTADHLQDFIGKALTGLPLF